MEIARLETQLNADSDNVTDTDTDTDCDALKQQNSDLESQIQDLQARILALQNVQPTPCNPGLVPVDDTNTDDTCVDTNLHHTTVSQLETQLQTASNRVTDLEAQLQELANSKPDGYYDNIIKGHVEQIEQLEARLDSLQTQYDNKHAAHQLDQERIVQMQTQIADLTKAVLDLQAELDKELGKDPNQGDQPEVDPAPDCTALEEAHRAEIEQLHQEMTALKDSHALDIAEIREDHANAMATLQEELDRAIQDKAQLITSHDAEIHNMLSERAKLQDDIARLQSAVDYLTSLQQTHYHPSEHTDFVTIFNHTRTDKNQTAPSFNLGEVGWNHLPVAGTNYTEATLKAYPSYYPPRTYVQESHFFSRLDGSKAYEDITELRIFKKSDPNDSRNLLFIIGSSANVNGVGKTIIDKKIIRPNDYSLFRNDMTDTDYSQGGYILLLTFPSNEAAIYTLKPDNNLLVWVYTKSINRCLGPHGLDNLPGRGYPW